MRGKLYFVAVAVLAMCATGAWAQEGEGGVIDNVMTACEPEITAYCSQVTPGEGRLLACFYAHQDKLSGQCEYALYEAAAALEDFAAAVTYLAESCIDDMEKFCGQVELGEGRVATCLVEHKAEVTDACRQAMDDVGLELVEE
ncbi:MAG TPA: cysteine rich repeat-containing protein [Candidatus Sulfomarinibacteraceae bacterium]|nr:cysteine rich repeat-containing protein [Candidatus Sulfomarinibacteraceae bacterium]